MGETKSNIVGKWERARVRESETCHARPASGCLFYDPATFGKHAALRLGTIDLVRENSPLRANHLKRHQWPGIHELGFRTGICCPLSLSLFWAHQFIGQRRALNAVSSFSVSSEKGKKLKCLRTLPETWLKPRPTSGHGYLVCAIFARRRRAVRGCPYGRQYVRSHIGWSYGYNNRFRDITHARWISSAHELMSRQ